MAAEPTINAASGRPWEDSDVTDRAAQYDQQGHIRQVGIARYSDFSDSEHAIRSDCVVAVPQIGCNYSLLALRCNGALTQKKQDKMDARLRYTVNGLIQHDSC